MATPELEHEIKQLIIDSLKLEDMTADQIDAEAPLFVDGLGLDSIDALELAMAVRKKYGLTTQSDDDQNHTIYSSVRNLANYVEGELAKRADKS
ncbi:MAG: acyl carrier protein [Myxococcaceae bacterium]|nr:acyl carrier protein [Myxococcaceae bacterium]